MNFLSTAATVIMLLLPNLVFADNQDYPGYLGVYVVEADDGMEITGFIRDTPAPPLLQVRQGGFDERETCHPNAFSIAKERCSEQLALLRTLQCSAALLQVARRKRVRPTLTTG